MSGERESLWGAQRKRPVAPAEDRQVDDGASPKERHVLDLQQKAGNAAVAGVVQRSLWGDVSEWFGGGDAKGAEAGGGAKDLGYEQPMGGKGFGDLGEKGGGAKDFGFEEPMGEKGFGGKGFGDLGEKGGGAKDFGFEEPMGEKGFGDKDLVDEQPMGEKGSGGYEEKGVPELEEKGGYDGWGDGPVEAPPEQGAKGEDTWIN